MSDFKNRLSNLTPKQLILLADSLNTRLEEAGRTATEPLAVIGLGCRFPGGADSPDAFWDLLVNGRQGIREVPPDRWDIDAYFDPNPDQPGKMNTRWGGFLENIDQFDADFFGISPREAVTMDPQQRLLLEVAWETLEHAGVNPRDLAGSPTGVYVGICNSDYFQLLMREGPANIDAYLATGSAHSIASGRISYILGLEGPSLSVDTACSSSLIAVHLACQSLRLGECRLALAGGVNLILAPETTIALSKSRMMSPDGRCKTFDKAANGFVRGEGCGMVALKRLSDAESDGDHIIALILGSAANQDGRSSGITAPNGPSQAAVIRKALRNAGLEPAAIGYIEAHGTGTSLGDPIEMGALAEVFGAGQRPFEPAPGRLGQNEYRPCRIGSRHCRSDQAHSLGEQRRSSAPPSLSLIPIHRSTGAACRSGYPSPAKPGRNQTADGSAASVPSVSAAPTPTSLSARRPDPPCLLRRQAATTGIIWLPFPPETTMRCVSSPAAMPIIWGGSRRPPWPDFAARSRQAVPTTRSVPHLQPGRYPRFVSV